MAKAAATVAKNVKTAARALGDGTLMEKLKKVDWAALFELFTTMMASCQGAGASPGKLRSLLRSPDALNKKVAEREVKLNFLANGGTRAEWRRHGDEVVEFALSQGREKATQDTMLQRAQELVDSGELNGEDE